MTFLYNNKVSKLHLLQNRDSICSLGNWSSILLDYLQIFFYLKKISKYEKKNLLFVSF